MSKKFKYTTLCVNESDLKDEQFIHEELNKLGAEGWELVAIDTGNNYLRTYYFKLEIKIEFV